MKAQNPVRTTEQALEYFRDDITAAIIDINYKRSKEEKHLAEGFNIYINKLGTGWRIIPTDAELNKTQLKKMDKLYTLAAVEAY